jgi:hypothetical protein
MCVEEVKKLRQLLRDRYDLYLAGTGWTVPGNVG